MNVIICIINIIIITIIIDMYAILMVKKSLLAL